MERRRYESGDGKQGTRVQDLQDQVQIKQAARGSGVETQAWHGCATGGQRCGEQGVSEEERGSRVQPHQDFQQHQNQLDQGRL